MEPMQVMLKPPYEPVERKDYVWEIRNPKGVLIDRLHFYAQWPHLLKDSTPEEFELSNGLRVTVREHQPEVLQADDIG